MQQMRSLAETLRDAREGARLSEAMMARLLGVAASELKRMEEGKEEASPAVLDRYAQTFGLSLRRFMAGEAEQAPMALLFRSMHDTGRPGLEDLVESEAHRVLGEFLRCTRDITELREVLGERRETSLLDRLRPRPVEPGSTTPHDAERLAMSVRELLGLELGPIPSMTDLVERTLGVDLLWVSPEDLDPSIDAASARAPSPAILVNLVQGAECWWRTRMTLAHEIGHLIFDRSLLGGARRRGFFLFSPKLPRVSGRGTRAGGASRWHLFDDFESIERRANAFAAYFLAPPSGVRHLVSRMDVMSEAAITAVCHRYGIGREAAINVLINAHGLSRDARQAMTARPHTRVLGAEHADRFSGVPGLRGGTLQDLTLRALAAGHIDRVQARDYLQLPLTEPLPPHPLLGKELRAPLRSVEDKVRLSAARYLLRRRGGELFHTGAVSREPDGWRVELLEGQGAGPFRAAGFLRMTHGLEVREEDSHLDAPPSSSRRPGRPRGPSTPV